MDRESRGTIVAGTAGQHYVDNVLFDPDNDYEIVTVNRSRLVYFPVLFTTRFIELNAFCIK